MSNKGFKERILILCALMAFLIAGIIWVQDFSNKNTLLFNTSLVWFFLLAMIVGALFSYLREDIGPEKRKNKVLRHPLGSFVDHWTHAVGFIVLVVSGLLLGVRSYLLSGFPLNYLVFPRLVGSVESVNFLFNLHFLGIVILLFAVSYHLSYHLRKKSTQILPRKGDFSASVKETLSLLGLSERPRGDKYEAIERLEYVGWGVIMGIIIVSGFLKIGAHVWWVGTTSPQWTTNMLFWANLLHDTFALIAALLFVVHVITAAIIPSSWPFIKSMLTGWMSKENIKHHHEEWYEKIEAKNQGSE